MRPVPPKRSPAAAVTSASDLDEHERAGLAEDAPDLEEDDYRALVNAAIWAACSVFVVKGLASILLALHYGATVEIRRFFGVIPYIGIRATRPVFAEVVTFSGLTMAIAAGIFFLVALVPRRQQRELGDQNHHRARRHRVIGWFLGVVISLFTLLIEGVRHLLDPPVLRFQWSAQSLAVLLATTVLFVAFLPREKTSRSTRSRRVGLETPASTLTQQQESPQT